MWTICSDDQMGQGVASRCITADPEASKFKNISVSAQKNENFMSSTISPLVGLPVRNLCCNIQNLSPTLRTKTAATQHRTYCTKYCSAFSNSHAETQSRAIYCTSTHTTFLGNAERFGDIHTSSFHLARGCTSNQIGGTFNFSYIPDASLSK